MELKEFDLIALMEESLSLECTSEILYKIICGVKHLHSGGIIHRVSVHLC